MSEAKITKVDSIDNTPGSVNGWDGAYAQGTEWTNWDVYKIETGLDVVYIKVGLVFDSYGEQRGSAEPQLCTPRTETVQVWE